MTPLLSIEDLRVHIRTRDRGIVRAVDGVSLTVSAGETVALVGESGSGKSVLGLTLLRLEPPGAEIVSGRIYFMGQDLARLPARRMRTLRGRHISMILQDPNASLNPAIRIRHQVGEVISKHRQLHGAQLIEATRQALESVNIPTDRSRLDQYPYQFSGGMRQRIAAAIAMAGQPELIVADEPTTALDVTVQADFLLVLRKMVSESKTALIFVTHDLAVAKAMADRVAVMYAGRLVELAGAPRFFQGPAHPYSVGLLECSEVDPASGDLATIPGTPPDATSYPAGCRFAPRCPRVRHDCVLDYPPIKEVDGRLAACLYPHR